MHKVLGQTEIHIRIYKAAIQHIKIYIKVSDTYKDSSEYFSMNIFVSGHTHCIDPAVIIASLSAITS